MKETNENQFKTDSLWNKFLSISTVRVHHNKKEVKLMIFFGCGREKFQGF